MIMKTLLLVLLSALVGCGTVAKTSGLAGPVSAYSGLVCVLPGTLPAGVASRQIGLVSASKGSYGGTDEVLLAMANEARRVGADAIVNAAASERFKGPLPWRVVAPSGHGVAIRLSDESFRCEDSGGKLL